MQIKSVSPSHLPFLKFVFKNPNKDVSRFPTHFPTILLLFLFTCSAGFHKEQREQETEKDRKSLFTPQQLWRQPSAPAGGFLGWNAQPGENTLFGDTGLYLQEGAAVTPCFALCRWRNLLAWGWVGATGYFGLMAICLFRQPHTDPGQERYFHAVLPCSPHAQESCRSGLLKSPQNIWHISKALMTFWILANILIVLLFVVLECNITIFIFASLYFYRFSQNWRLPNDFIINICIIAT